MIFLSGEAIISTFAKQTKENYQKYVLPVKMKNVIIV